MPRSRIITLLSLTALFSSLVAVGAVADELTVERIVHVVNCPDDSLQAAIDAAAPGDILRVSGDCTGQGTVTNWHKPDLTVEALDDTADVSQFVAGAAGSIFRGFHVGSVTVSGDNSLVTENVVSDQVGLGTTLGGDDIEVSHNAFEGPGAFGVVVRNAATNASVVHNTITGRNIGVRVLFDAGHTVAHNDISAGLVGLDLWDADDNTIHHNTICHNNIDVRIVAGSTANYLHSNQFDSLDDDGDGTRLRKNDGC